MKKKLAFYAVCLAHSLGFAGWQTFIAEEIKRLPVDDTPYISLDRAIATEAKAEAAYNAKDGTVSAEDLAVYRYYVYARARQIAPFYSVRPQEDAEELLAMARTTPSQGWNYAQRHQFAQVAFERTTQVCEALKEIPIASLSPVTDFANEDELLWTDGTLLESFIAQTYTMATAEDEDDAVEWYDEDDAIEWYDEDEDVEEVAVQGDADEEEKQLAFPHLIAAIEKTHPRLKDYLQLQALKKETHSFYRYEEEDFNAFITKVETFIKKEGLYLAVRDDACILYAQSLLNHRNQIAREATPEDAAQQKVFPLLKGPETIELLEDVVHHAKLYRLRWEAQNLINHIRAKEVRLLATRELLPEHPQGQTVNRLSLAYQNEKRITVTFQKTEKSIVKGTYENVGAPIVKQYTLPAPKDYAVATTQIDCPALEHGTYTVTLTTDKHTFQELKQTPAKTQLVISDFTLACVARNPVTYFVADIQTGEPCVGAELVCNGQKVTTNTLGLAVLSLPKTLLNSLLQVTYKGKTLVQENTFLQESRYNSTGRTFLLYPNCGIYRPGDKVQVQILALEDDATRRRKQARGNFSMPLKVVGHTATGESVTLFKEQIVTFSERGVVDIAFTLPEDFVGNMTLELPKENRRTFGLPQVLEFKPPAMSVSVEEMKKDTCFGESVPVKIKAVDASNVPLEGAKATCKITRNEKTREEIVTLDAKGEAMLSILPEADRHEAKEGAYTWRNVQLDIQVVAANGERSDAGLLVSQCRYGYTLKMNIPDWKLANEAFTMRVTSDERASVEGTLAIYTYVKEKDAKADTYKRGEKVYEVPLNDTLNYPITLPAGNYLAVATSGKVERSESFIVLPQDGDLNKVDIGLQQRYYWDPQELFFIINDTDSTTGQPKTFTVGTAVECYIAAKTPMPFFYAISTLDGTKTIRKCEGNRFFVSVTPDMIGNASLMLFGLSKGRFYSSSEEVTITPPPELTVTATRVPEEVLPGSEQTWELTVDDPTAEMVITCYDAMIDRISPLRWSLINSTFPTLGWSHRARLRPYYSDWLHLLYREALPSDPCRFSGYAVAPQMLKRSVTSDRMLGAKNAVMDGVMPEAAPVALGMVEEDDECYDAEMEDADEGGFGTPAKVRSNFARAATWVPQKRLVDGKAVFSFTLPDTLTTWQLKAFAYTPDGRSGLLAKQIVAKQEVMLRPYLPRRLRVGDRITLNVAVSNTTQKTISTWVELNNGQRREVTLEPERSTTVSWEVAANFRPGTQAFAFTSPYDALRVELPVDDNRIAIEDVYPITLKHTEPYSLSVLTPTPEVALTERWNHRPNDLVIKALQHQLIFPYGCSEQTFAKLNAMLLLKAYNAAPADADKQIAELQGKLLGMRQAGKLWPWFPGGDEDPYITAEICVGAARLKTLGHLPVELEAAVREVLEKQADRLPFPAWAYARTAWLKEWPLEDDLTDECLRERKFAGIQERLYLAIAAQRLGIETVAQGGLDSVLAAMTTSDIWGTQWPQERTWWNWYSTPIETHVLRAEVLRMAGRLDDAEGAALWLMQNIRMNDWGSTRATTAAVYCLLQSKIAKQSDKAPTVTCTKVAASDGVRSTLTYQKDTEGLSFGSVVANYSLRIEDVPPLELPPEYGVTIKRIYTPSNPKVGETIKVKLQIEAAQPLDRVWIQDHRPAHTEPMIQQPRWDWSTRAYLLPGDKGLDIFIGDLRRGTTVIEYELKATHAGTCTPGLATLQSMYAPDFATRTTAQPMTITP